MKKFLILLFLIFSFNPIVSADNIEVEKELEEVELINCISSDTFFIKRKNGEKLHISLISYASEDTPLNKEIEDYVCTKIKEANKVEIEIDPLMMKLDTYHRQAVWLYLDGKLLQNTLIAKGYGQVNNVYDNYLYLDLLCDTQKEALQNNLGIWEYPEITEVFCQSGSKNNSNVASDQENDKTKNNNINIDFKILLLFNSGILLLVILLYLRRKSCAKID